MMFSRPAFARCAPFALFIGFLMLGSLLDAPWIALVRAVVVAGVLAWFWRSYRELRGDAPRARATDWLLAAAAGIGVFVAWIVLDQDWATFSRVPGLDPRTPEGAIDWPVALLRLAGLAVVVPVMEELFWRSFVLRWLERQEFMSVTPRSVGQRSFWITTGLFALEHNQWLAGAIAGAVYNGLYMRSGNLWVPILAHALTNALLGCWILATQNWHFW